MRSPAIFTGAQRDCGRRAAPRILPDLRLSRFGDSHRPGYADAAFRIFWPCICAVARTFGSRRSDSRYCISLQHEGGVRTGRVRIVRRRNARRICTCRCCLGADLLYAQGAWRAYLDQVWIWSSAYAGSTFLEHPVRNGITRTLAWIGFHSGLAGRWSANWRLWVWLALSFAGVALGWRFFPRYYLQILPPAVILAKRGVGQARAMALCVSVSAVDSGHTIRPATYIFARHPRRCGME